MTLILVTMRHHLKIEDQSTNTAIPFATFLYEHSNTSAQYLSPNETTHVLNTANALQYSMTAAWFHSTIAWYVCVLTACMAFYHTIPLLKLFRTSENWEHGRKTMMMWLSKPFLFMIAAMMVVELGATFHWTYYTSNCDWEKELFEPRCQADLIQMMTVIRVYYDVAYTYIIKIVAPLASSCVIPLGAHMLLAFYPESLKVTTGQVLRVVLFVMVGFGVYWLIASSINEFKVILAFILMLVR